MAARTLPSQTYLRQCFDYDSTTGILTWRERPREHFASNLGWLTTNAQRRGKVVSSGSHSKGYLRVGLCGRSFLAHRIIWKLLYGLEPDTIDHANGNVADNRLANLRDCSGAENLRNRGKQVNNTSGFKGVTAHQGRWLAQIGVSGRNVYLGTFETASLAGAAYAAAAAKYHNEFSNPG